VAPGPPWSRTTVPFGPGSPKLFQNIRYPWIDANPSRGGVGSLDTRPGTTLAYLGSEAPARPPGLAFGGAATARRVALEPRAGGDVPGGEAEVIRLRRALSDRTTLLNAFIRPTMAGWAMVRAHSDNSPPVTTTVSRQRAIAMREGRSDHR